MKKEINIIGHKKIFLSISGTLVFLSIVAIALFGFNPGIDFVGGTMWKIEINGNINTQTLRTFLSNDTKMKDPIVQRDESIPGGFIIKTRSLSEHQHQQYLSLLKKKFSNVKELKFESVGATIGNHLRDRAVKASILVLLGISLYVAYAFRKVSYSVKSWKYGFIVLGTLFHDVIIPTGMLAVLGHYYGVEMSSNFIVALLVIMGFSVHDTIVVFDRIRENILIKKGTVPFSEVVNTSVNQTMARSINTSFTLALVLVAMLVLGSESLNLFVLTMLVGTIVGTYSSIFVASPLLTLWQKFGKN